jgi:hypothetical protein
MPLHEGYFPLIFMHAIDSFHPFTLTALRLDLCLDVTMTDATHPITDDGYPTVSSNDHDKLPRHLPPASEQKVFHGRMTKYSSFVVGVIAIITIIDLLKESRMMKSYISRDISARQLPIRKHPDSSSSVVPMKNHSLTNDSSGMALPKEIKRTFSSSSTDAEAAPEEDDGHSRLSSYSESIPIDKEDLLLSIQEYVVKKLSDRLNKDEIEKLVQNLEFSYANVQEMLNRPQRFPSIEQRVKIYMSNWYIPPCDDAARVSYYYTKLSQNYVLTVLELSLQQQLLEKIVDTDQKQQQEQRMFHIDSNFAESGKNDDSFDTVHFMDRELFLGCKHRFCRDTVEHLLPSLDRELNNNTGVVVSNNENDHSIPILYQFGDVHRTRASELLADNTLVKHKRYPRIPVIQKARNSISPYVLRSITDDVQYECYKHGERRAPVLDDDHSLIYNVANYESIHLEPIIFKLKTRRHYEKIFQVSAADRIPWEEKKSMGVFRGSLTGTYPEPLKLHDVVKLSIPERCRLLQRCWFTYTHTSSKLIDAKLTEPFSENKMIPRTIYRLINDDGANSNSSKIELYGEKKSMEELLQYKALIMLEGNDISSGLKWALFSNSVVLMPEPLLTSWSMEEMLMPWVHYIPINVIKDGNDIIRTTDTEEKLQWIIDNDEKAKEIAKAGKLWIADLVLHPQVQQDEMRIFEQIARRYVTHFSPHTEGLQ